MKLLVEIKWLGIKILIVLKIIIFLFILYEEKKIANVFDYYFHNIDKSISDRIIGYVFNKTDYKT